LRSTALGREASVEWELSLFLRNKEVSLGILEKMRDIVHVGPAIRCVCSVCVRERERVRERV
jgi:hypothetical protein